MSILATPAFSPAWFSADDGVAPSKHKGANREQTARQRAFIVHSPIHEPATTQILPDNPAGFNTHPTIAESMGARQRVAIDVGGSGKHQLADGLIHAPSAKPSALPLPPATQRALPL